MHAEGGDLDGPCPWVLSPHSIFEGEGGAQEKAYFSAPLHPCLLFLHISSSLKLDLLQLTESWDR